MFENKIMEDLDGGSKDIEEKSSTQQKPVGVRISVDQFTESGKTEQKQSFFGTNVQKHTSFDKENNIINSKDNRISLDLSPKVKQSLDDFDF